MSEEKRCPICGSENVKIINEAKTIEKETHTGYIIGLIIFSIIGLIGFFIAICNIVETIPYAQEVKDLTAKKSVDTEVAANVFVSYIALQAQYETNKIYIWLGIMLILLGIIGDLFVCFYHNIDEKFEIKYEVKTFCEKCGKKSKVKKEQENIEKSE